VAVCLKAKRTDFGTVLKHKECYANAIIIIIIIIVISPGGIYGEESGTGTVFLPLLRLSSVGISPSVFHTHPLICHHAVLTPLLKK
jgi:hypothetical protein